jgi:hypothetical protein
MVGGPFGSKLCSWSMEAYLGSFKNFGTESCNPISFGKQQSGVGRKTYAGHELEDRRLSLFEECNDILERFQHRLVVSHRTSHATGQAVAQVVIDVQFAGRSWSQKCIVEA